MLTLQAAKAGKAAQGDDPVGDLRTNVGDGEGDVPQVLSRCQVLLWEANMAVQAETAPINEQLRELLRNRYSEEVVSMPGTVDVGQGERRRVSLQVWRTCGYSRYSLPFVLRPALQASSRGSLPLPRMKFFDFALTVSSRLKPAPQQTWTKAHPCDVQFTSRTSLAPQGSAQLMELC